MPEPLSRIPLSLEEEHTVGSMARWIGGAFVLVASVALWQSMILYHAGDDFHLMASTDAADLDYLARGLDRLRTFFKIQVLTVVVAVSVAFVTGIIAVRLWRST